MFLTLTTTLLVPGTGTVLVTVEDDNDNPPKLAKSNFKLRIRETSLFKASNVTSQTGNFDDMTSDNEVTPILAITVSDPDITNDFAYKVS